MTKDIFDELMKLNKGIKEDTEKLKNCDVKKLSSKLAIRLIDVPIEVVYEINRVSECELYRRLD